MINILSIQDQKNESWACRASTSRSAKKAFTVRVPLGFLEFFFLFPLYLVLSILSCTLFSPCDFFISQCLSCCQDLGFLSYEFGSHDHASLLPSSSHFARDATAHAASCLWVLCSCRINGRYPPWHFEARLEQMLVVAQLRKSAVKIIYPLSLQVLNDLLPSHSCLSILLAGFRGSWSGEIVCRRSILDDKSRVCVMWSGRS